MSDKPISNALRDTTFFFIAISLLVQSLLYNIIPLEAKITLEIALASFFYTGWVKKGLEITIGEYIISIRKKDGELSQISSEKMKLEQKVSVLDDLVSKLNGMLGLKKEPG